MSILKVIQEPSPLLHKKTMRVEKFDQGLKDYGYDLLETMYAHDAAALASNQVVDDARVAFENVLEGYRNQPSVVAINFYDAKSEEQKIIVNPEIIEHGDKIEFGYEGCVSVPNFPVRVGRFERVVIKYQDLSGKEHIKELQKSSNRRNYDYITIQHEIDHLLGITLISKATENMNAMQKLVVWKQYERALNKRR